jgi:hypothetical protein
MNDPFKKAATKRTKGGKAGKKRRSTKERAEGSKKKKNGSTSKGLTPSGATTGVVGLDVKKKRGNTTRHV